MGKRIFVGNLPFSATDQVLMDTFAQYGTVESAKVITDRATGRSKGFGFVEMATDAEALAAIEKLNGAEYEGRTITVNEAREMQPREGGGGGRGGRPGGGGGGTVAIAQAAVAAVDTAAAEADTANPISKLRNEKALESPPGPFCFIPLKISIRRVGPLFW